jgi:hypothetical protein
MTIKASGCSALILATGLFVCLAGPSQAATGADNAAAGSKSERASALHKHARHGARHWKSHAHRKSGEVALKSDDGDKSSVIPPSVADANAQMTSADSPAGNARAMSARANDILQAADAQVVAADQLNDVDRALHESPPPAATLAMASADAPVAAATEPVMAGSSSTWDQTSLIGKIFIGFGALLTIASAARMFMA